MTFMYDDVHICTYSMQLEAPGGYLCPRWYIIAFQMAAAAGIPPRPRAGVREGTRGRRAAPARHRDPEGGTAKAAPRGGGGQEPARPRRGWDDRVRGAPGARDVVHAPELF